MTSDSDARADHSARNDAHRDRLVDFTAVCMVIAMVVVASLMADSVPLSALRQLARLMQ